MMHLLLVSVIVLGEGGGGGEFEHMNPLNQPRTCECNAIPLPRSWLNSFFPSTFRVNTTMGANTPFPSFLFPIIVTRARDPLQEEEGAAKPPLLPSCRRPEHSPQTEEDALQFNPGPATLSCTDSIAGATTHFLTSTPIPQTLLNSFRNFKVPRASQTVRVCKLHSQI
jgi:hypothetical protein